MCIIALFISSPPLQERNAAERLHESTAAQSKRYWSGWVSLVPSLTNHASEILIISNVLFDFSLRNKKSSETLFKQDVLGYPSKVAQN